ncbi:MAG: nucleotidyltransferase [Candidatus Diapherotrites archaeon]|nr:nucleotidyltransferase [Candidatus Diapherotrites archaeon]
MEGIPEEKLKKVLKIIKERLENLGIDWAVTGGLAAVAYGSKRPVKDIDIFFFKKDSEKIVEAFKEFLKREPAYEKKQFGDAWNIYFEIDGVTVEFVSNSRFHINGQTYHFNPSFKMFTRVREVEIAGIPMKVLSPEDIVVLKSITQRGADQGKYDYEDVKSICLNKPLDLEYIRSRAFNCNAQKRVIDFLKSLR